MVRAALLPHNYPQLQNLIKRDHASYREEFLQQYSHFKSSLQVLTQVGGATGAVADENFEALVTFLSHVASLYPESKEEFPHLLMDLLGRDSASAAVMTGSLRRSLVQGLLLLRKHNSVPLAPLLELLFRLLRVQDKALRDFLYTAIVGEVRRANRPQRNNQLNKSLQNFMYGILADASRSVSTDPLKSSTISRAPEADEQTLSALHKTLQITIELYRRRIWEDGRTVNVIADAAVRAISAKITTTALHFFVGRFRGEALMFAPGRENEDFEGGNNDEEEDATGQNKYKTMLFRSQLNGSKRSTQKKLKKQLDSMHRKEKATSSSLSTESADSVNRAFSPIQMLNDPQGFAERLFALLKRSNDSFEVKLLLMNVISRVIGAHELVLLDYYSFLLRYILPHQKEVTQILAYAAQASHPLVPTDAIAPVVQAIARNFVAEFCQANVIAAGINGLTAICRRCPAAMDGDLLSTIVATFKGYADKGVVMATRGLISYYREVNPMLLHRRERGKEVSIALASKPHVAPKYGQRTFLDASKRASGKEINGISEINNRSNVDGTDQLECSSDSQYDSSVEDEFDSNSNVETASLDESDGEGGNDSTFDYDSDDEIADGDEEWNVCLADSQHKEEESLQTKDTMKSSKGHSKSGHADIVQLATERPLTSKEFALLRRRIAGLDKAAEDEASVEKDSDVSSQSEDDEESSFNTGLDEGIDPKSLETSHKSRQDYEARMESIKTGRLDRLKYGSRMGKHNEKASVSNALKSKKTKNPIMLAHKQSVRAKKRRSGIEIQEVTRKHAKLQKRRH